MNLYKGTKIGVRVDSQLSLDLSEKFKVWMHQKSVPSLFLLAVVVDVVAELTRGVLSEFLYVDNYVLMSERIMGLRNMFIK